RYGGKRTNWLLIKHRDLYAHGGDKDRLLAADRSVASGRSMAAIAAGKGRGPKAYMLAGAKAARADAVWNSNRGDGSEAAGDDAPAAAAMRSTARHAAMPEFIKPQLCRLVDRPPVGAEWAHEVKLDGYRLQLRVMD